MAASYLNLFSEWKREGCINDPQSTESVRCLLYLRFIKEPWKHYDPLAQCGISILMPH